MRCRPEAGEIIAVIDHADFFPDVRIFVPHLSAEQLYRAAVFPDRIQDAVDGGGLSGPVFPDEAQNGSVGQREGKAVQGEIRFGIGLGDLV